jgi:murein DD-endopeptidase MepM/ murein hydrolase activator NlpD
MAYVTKKGDTLGAIAKANGTTVDELMGLNPSITNANVIGIGQTINLPGETSSTTAAGGTATGGQELNNIGGTPEVWKVGNAKYIVYTVPGTEDDPVYVAWQVPSDSDLQSFFGPDQPILYNKQITWEAFKNMGVLDFGSTDELANTSDDPFSTWVKDMDMMSQTQPWILDADYQALVAMSILEGRELTQAELATTDWWTTHTKAEREWMIVQHGDPATAAQKIADQEAAVTQMLANAGMGIHPPEAIVSFLAYQSLSGAWSDIELQNQIRALSDPYSNIVMDSDLATMLDDNPFETGVGNITEEDTVRQLLSTWLGPLFGEWDDDEVARIAGTFRNDPMAEQKFIESLKDQRMALLPEYTDRELSYAAISNTWKQWWLGQWGQAPDEKSDLWMQVIRANDTASSGQLLRAEGLEQGVGKVLTDFSKQSVGNIGSVRNPIG